MNALFNILDTDQDTPVDATKVAAWFINMLVMLAAYVIVAVGARAWGFLHA